MIRLTDNGICESVLTETEHEKLKLILNRPLEQLQDEHKGKLLIFPHSFKRNGDDGAAAECVLSSTSRESKEDKQREYLIHAGNVAGFISCGGMQISICSRFSCQKEGGGMEDHFLHYMLQKVLSVNISSLPHRRDKEQIFDFLPFLFPGFLNRALQQGLYKEYRRERHNDARVRGSIDISRHLRLNMPFSGKVAYTTREFSHDNSVTQLVRHTIEYLLLRHSEVLTANNTCRENVATIITATPSYNRQARSQLLRQKVRQHPYFTEYGPLQTLCRSILMHETLSYGNDDNEVHGILFDVAWLWEEYLATLLVPHGFTHPRNKDNKGWIWLAKGSSSHKFKRYPDFYLPTAGATAGDSLQADIVADAKYKKNFTVDADANQIITYMYRLMAKRGIFLLPEQTPQPETESWELLGYRGWLGCLRLSIPQASPDFASFSQSMREQEKEFNNRIGKLLKSEQSTGLKGQE